MRKILLSTILLMVIACNKEFEPELTGWKAYTHPYRHRLHLEIDGKETIVELPGDARIGYRYAQWTKSQHQILLTQLIKTEDCTDYQLILADTTGAIVDTIYTAPPNTPINFKLAPNDSLLLLKTYYDNCADARDQFRYTFYNRYLKTALPDTITVENSRGIPLRETIWSPDSKKVILSDRSGRQVKAFVYHLLTKDTTYIDKGTNFVWSPVDNDLVAYMQDYSIYTKNIKTGVKESLYEGKRKRSAYDFRWNPQGDFLMVHIKSYILNIEARPLTRTTIVYFSMKDRIESRVFLDAQQIDTWINAPGDTLK